MSTIETTAFDRARAQARGLLAESTAFKDLSDDEKKAMYIDLVRSLSRELSNGAPLSAAMVQPAGRMIDDKRHLNQRIDQLGDIASDFVEAVDFPKFVRDLLKGVFDANLDVTIKQMEAYGNLLKLATASVSSFVNKIDNTAAFGYLAENKSDEFGLDFSDLDEDKSADNPQGMVLTDKDGNKLDIGDNEVKAKIMDAKIAMAREQRALLREMILMGVTRLVVERGNVKAGVIFDFKATEKIAKADKAAAKESRSTGGSISASGGLMGSIFGGPRGGQSWSHQEATITVASAKSQADTSLAAKLTGSVDITFKSDYFKLDNFATMYGPITREGAPAAALPAGTPAPVGTPAATAPTR
jgi:hypothetical protein